ncbi:MAG: ASCH domain-containing protein [Chloroflexota bacterium]
MHHHEEHILAFWRRYLATLPEHHPNLTKDFTAWHFGGGDEMADRLVRQVQRGQKTATSSALWVYHDDPEKSSPQAGDMNILLNSAGEPVCIVETTHTDVEPFRNITEAFARAEGDGTLDNWREIHTAYFTQVCEKIGRDFSEDMPVVCEYFKLVFNPPARKDNS